MDDAGRSFAELEVIGGIRPTFTDATGPTDLNEAAASIPGQIASGYTAIGFNPSQYVADVADVPRTCLVEMVEGLEG